VIEPRELNGHALRARYTHNDRNWSGGAAYIEYSPGFRADAGLFDQVGVRFASASAQRRIRGGPDRWFRNLYFGLGGDNTREYNGKWNEWGADVTASYEGPRQLLISANLLAPNQEHFNGRTYHNLRHNFSVQLEAVRDVTVGVSANWGESIDFTNSRAADFYTLTPFATFNVGAHVGGDVSWVRQTFRTQTGGDRIFTVDLPQARVLYHFNGRSFVRAILQYRDVSRDPAQYIIPVSSRSKSLLSQFLFSYQLNAQTAVYCGYSDNYSGIDLTRTNRAVFMKVGYAFLF
jgi:hypothetical protein